jgi:RimJ/RimL family protein N-acetyltransferase
VSNTIVTKGPILRGRRVKLRPFAEGDITPRYLGWLSDPEVNRFSRRFGSPPVGAHEARSYMASLAPDEVVLAIETDRHGHVGNLKYGPIDRGRCRSDISIVIGEKDIWGQGIGKEAIYLATRYLFEVEHLDRVDAGSGNPAFLAMVESLGWRREGVLDRKVQIGDRKLAWTLVAQSRADFRRRPEFEEAT